MRILVERIRRNIHLLVLSVFSALFVVLLQLLVNHLSTITTQTNQLPSIDTAVAEIIPITQSASIKQIMSTLQEDALDEFHTSGMYEDTQVLKNVKRAEVHLETLFISLDHATSYREGTNTDKDVHIKLVGNRYLDVSICDTKKHYQESCTIYLVSKTGQSVPVTVNMSKIGNNREATITLSPSVDPNDDYRIYRAKPIGFDIHAI